MSKGLAFSSSVVELERNRFIAPHKMETLVVYKAEPRPVQPVVEARLPGFVWSLPQSIWAPRAQWCDSKDFVDTDETELLKFTKDWQNALDVQGIDKMIVKTDDGADSEGASEVEEVRAVLWEFHDRYFALFAYYAGTFGNDILTITFNGWSQFVVDCKLASNESKNAKKADMDRLFIAVEAKQRRSATSGDVPKKSLTRAGFLAALVQVAIAKYVQPKEIPDVSDALHVLFSEDIEPRLDKRLFAESNAFRLQYCYLQDVDDVLRRHEANLRRIFGGISKSEGKQIGMEHLLQLCDFTEWSLFIRGLDFIGPDLTERDARLCFVNARMAVIDGQSPKGFVKEGNLPFEGFLEAIVRLSVLKALPTDEEIFSNGFSDAGAYLKDMRENDAASYEVFVNSRGQSWPGAPARQEIFRCVEHVITLIIRMIEGQTAGDDDRLLTQGEVAEFVQRCNAR